MHKHVILCVAILQVPEVPMYMYLVSMVTMFTASIQMYVIYVPGKHPSGPK